MTKTLALAVLLLAACNSKNQNYCPDHPENNCLEDASVDGSGSASCAVTGCLTGVCDTTTGVCGQCTSAQSAACTATTPVCGAMDTCRGCGAHSECTTSNTCLPSGACGDETQIAYVASAAAGGTANTACTQATPCLTMLAGLATGRPVIKISGTITEQVGITSGTVTLLGAPGAQLTATGTILTLSGTASVSVYDLQLHGALGGSNVALTGSATLALHRSVIDGATAYGVDAQSGTTLVIDRSTISLNTAGGINLVGASFDITNTFIIKNGSPGSTFGGVSVFGVGGSHAIEFSTIASNGGNASVTNGIVCGNLASLITFSNNIIYGNINDTQVSGNNCAFAYSDIGPTTQGTNLNVAPSFVSVSTSNFHLMTGSPVEDQADPAAVLATDFDGNPRPQGLHSDIGADEVMP